MQDLLERLRSVKASINGCESLSVASNDGFVLATTHPNAREGEMLAAITSVVLSSCSRGLAPLRVGECRALDFRGDRQILITRLQDMQAFLICVLHPGAVAVNIDEPALRGVANALPDVLHGETPTVGGRFLLQRDSTCLIPVRRGFLIGRESHCDLVVPNKEIDPEHLRFEILGTQLMIRDLGTEHGTKLNMRAFTGTREAYPGDRISLPGSGGFNIVGMTPEGVVIDSKQKSKRKSKKSQRK